MPKESAVSSAGAAEVSQSDNEKELETRPGAAAAAEDDESKKRKTQEKYNLFNLSKVDHNLIGRICRFAGLKGAMRLGQVTPNFREQSDIWKWKLALKALLGLDTTSKSHIPQEHVASKSFEALYKSSIDMCGQQLFSTVLLQAVAMGNIEVAEELLKDHPDALTDNTGVAYDYSGHKIEGLTSFQAAICRHQGNFCKMMEPYFDKLSNPNQTGSGKALMQQQTEELLQKLGVDSFEELDARREKNAFDFKQIIQDINGASANDIQLALNLENDKSKYDNPAFCDAMDRFRKVFDTHVALHDDLAFNYHHHLQALNAYEEQDNQWTGNSYDEKLNKQDLFARQVEGYTARKVPVFQSRQSSLNRGMFPLKDGSHCGFDFGWSWHASRRNAGSATSWDGLSWTQVRQAHGEDGLSLSVRRHSFLVLCQTTSAIFQNYVSGVSNKGCVRKALK